LDAPLARPLSLRARLWREATVLGLYALCALVLTWPLCVTPGDASGLRPDYSLALWNAWWFGESLAQLASPFTTDVLFHPEGLSLARAPLSPLNALFGAGLRLVLEPDAVYSVLILLHLTLSGWTFSLLARRETGSAAGAFVGGLVFAFAPFHLFYLCQLNVFTFEFVPLALLFALRAYRGEGRGNVLGLSLSLGAVAATSAYFALLVFGLLALVLLAGNWVAPAIPRRAGAGRLLVALVPGTLVVALVFLPLILATVGRDLAAGEQLERANDLLGFRWYGPPEVVLVTWPVMFGSSSSWPSWPWRWWPPTPGATSRPGARGAAGRWRRPACAP
jgi:hypothetical protein